MAWRGNAHSTAWNDSSGGQRRQRGRGRGGGWRGRGGRGSRKIMSSRTLQEISEDDNLENIILELTSERGGFELLLNSGQLAYDDIEFIITAVSKACSSNHIEGLRTVLNIIGQSKFIESDLQDYISDHLSDYDFEDTIGMIHKIFDVIRIRLPMYSGTCFKCLQFIRQDIRCRGIELDEEVEEDISVLTGDMYQLCLGYTEDSEPPDNYRDMDMYPSPSDSDWLDEPYLRKNKGCGAYDDLDTYLDVQFRLLREDYIQPLRKGIKEYQKILSGKKPNQCADMWLYHDVHVIYSVCNEDVDTRLTFDVERVGRIRWQSTKRLVYGSLVCLSKDGFNTMLFATVTNRTVRDLLKGVLQVRFERDFDEVLNISPTDTFEMAETPAYFEAYRHVLKRLQNTEDDMPFQRYLVDCKTRITSPQYLNQWSRYNFESLGCAGYQRYLSSVQVLNTNDWPPLQVYKLNKMQLKAVETAMTKELAIIQGPPGTGKTYVGLNIMETLLSNKDQWPHDGSSNVILVVCYTNHALDQFLEGILEFHPDGIIRVGGRSSSEKLKDFNLKEIRYQRRKTRQRKKSVYENYTDCKKQMTQHKAVIDRVGSKLEVSMMGILNEEILRPHMMSTHYNSLRRGRVNPMPMWLEFHGTPRPSSKDRVNHSQIDDWTKTVLVYVNQLGEDDEEVDEDIYDMDMIERVKMYKTWTLKFRSHLSKQIAELQESIATQEAEKRLPHPLLLKLHSQLETSKKSIMEDKILRQFVPQGIYTKITSSMEFGKCHEGYAIKVWMGASPLYIMDDLAESIEELEEVIAQSSMSEEAADIINSQRFLDDSEKLFQRKTRSDVNRKSRELGNLAYNLHIDETVGHRWQSAEEQIRLEHTKQEKRRFNAILQKSPEMNALTEQSIRNVWNLNLEERGSLYRTWVRRYHLELKSSIKDSESQYRRIAMRLREVQQEEDREILEDADVIGMTTTGAAKHSALLQIVAPRIVVVEEAAEVLEAHIVTTLNPKCQQLILIGDHQQLRPNPTVYELAKRFNLDISLFERLVKNRLHHVTLECQHRMRPEISVLMKHIYPDLKDHESVTKFEDVKGVDKNVYFISHREEENTISETKSKSNHHEATFMIALCRYLLQQGYDSSDITMLAAYTGQISLMKRLMQDEKDLIQNVRLTSVDNYQGEECKIILLSFVRSNESGSVGFLSTDNRVCVALSRAKVGMFAVGNFDLLAQKSKLWSKIVSTLHAEHSIGSNLVLRCRNHPDETIEASTARDFDKAPSGGCTKVCGSVLKCGHTCREQCHMTDRDHMQHECKEQCRKYHQECGHRCKKACYRKCGRCLTKVTKTVPACGHSILIACSSQPDKCIDVCNKQLPCGHKCQTNCNVCTTLGFHGACRQLVKKQLKCGHEISTRCSGPLPKCQKPCEHNLICGHRCSQLCGDCLIFGHAKDCKEKVTKRYPCGHAYGIECNMLKLYPLCPGNCKKVLECGHACKGKCKTCSETGHVACKEEVEVTLDCRHVLKTTCSSSKSLLKCSQQCHKVLGCGHKCKGMCADCSKSSHPMCKEIVQRAITRCGHTCMVYCSATTAPRCSKPCNMRLVCHHVCKGKCGECDRTGHKLCDEKHGGLYKVDNL